MTKDIEVELRGRLSDSEYNQLQTALKNDGEFVEHKSRVLLDYSTMMEDEGVSGRKRDIRLRITNGQPEIITKLGSWGGNEHRRELSVKTELGSYDTLVETYAALGYKKAILAVRETDVFMYQDVEFALVTVPGHSYYFEAEQVVTEADDFDEIKSHVRKVCEELDLNIFSDQEFFDYIEELNTEANEVFDFDAMYEPNYFSNRFNF